MTKRELFCPKCKNKLEFPTAEKLPASFPFCSSRCKLIDLGAWAKEEYRMQAEDQSEEQDNSEQ